MMLFTLKVRHGRITVARKEKGELLTPYDHLDDTGVLVNFQTLDRQRNVVKGEDVFFPDGNLVAAPGDKWWLKKAVKYARALAV